MIQLTLTLKITTAQVVETSVTVNNNSPIQDYRYVHPDDQTRPTFERFKPFTKKFDWETLSSQCIRCWQISIPVQQYTSVYQKRVKLLPKPVSEILNFAAQFLVRLDVVIQLSLDFAFRRIKSSVLFFCFIYRTLQSLDTSVHFIHLIRELTNVSSTVS